jgi:hypothetical protein
MCKNETICVEEAGMGLRRRGLALKMIPVLSALAVMMAVASCSCGGDEKQPGTQDTATPKATQAAGGITVVPNTVATAESTPIAVAEEGGGKTVPAAETPPAAVNATVDAGSGAGGTEATAPLATATPAATLEPSTTPTAAATLAPTQEGVPAASPTFASVQGPTATPVPGPTATPAAQATRVFSSDPTETPAPNATPSPASPGSITGRILWDGVPVEEGVTVKLEDQRYNVIGEARVDDNGFYRFENLTPSSMGYNVLFAQEWNEEYEVDEAITWGWIGPVPVRGGAAVTLPDLEISLLGFEPVSPQPEASLVASDVSPDDPIEFEWEAYPGAIRYWVDLLYGKDQQRVWQSPLVEDTAVAFDGTLDDGAQIEPGAYWWGVGAQRAVGAYTLTVFGYLPPLKIESH